MGQLDGRVGIVTGAAQGIGREYALGAAAEGASVVAADLDDCQGVADELRARGGRAIAVQGDISDSAATQALARAALEEFGQIDFLVNNAAVYAALKPQFCLEIDETEWDRVMAVNIRGTFLASKAVAPHMMERGYGKIINISSGTALHGTPAMLHYVTSKAAVIGLTRSMARELGAAGVRVNVITPGFTMSEGSRRILRSSGLEEGDMTLGARALPREQQPEDLVGTMVYLASAASDYVTGQVINVDGGWICH